jgi:hypothetical protein
MRFILGFFSGIYFDGAKINLQAVKKSLALSAYPVESAEMMLGDVQQNLLRLLSKIILKMV